MAARKAAAKKAPGRLSFGRVRQERSGRWSAAYQHHGVLHRAPATFPTKQSATSWLDGEQHLIELDRITPGTWAPPAERAAKAAAKQTKTTVLGYARSWVRDKPISRRTRDSYTWLIESRLDGTELAALPVTDVTVADVREWFGALDATKPTARARAYEMLSSMFSSVVDDGLLTVTPCRVKGARKVRRARSVTHVESHEVDGLAQKMPEHLRAAVLLGAWCGLRFGELVALDRADVAEDGSTVTVSKGYTRRNGVSEIAAPKSQTSFRSVAVPPHIRAALVEHLAAHVSPAPTAPLFADADGERITEGKFRPHWHAARAAVGRPTLRVHDLRHHAGMVAAYAGATITESMARLGHSSPRMALHYAERAADRDALLAERLSALATEKPA